MIVSLVIVLVAVGWVAWRARARKARSAEHVGAPGVVPSSPAVRSPDEPFWLRDRPGSM